MLKTQLRFIITIVLVLGFSISLQSLIASWQEPTVAPPGVNIAKPINEGGVAQTKNGAFTTASDLGVGGDSIFGGKAIFGGDLDIHGDADLSQDLTVGGDIGVSGNTSLSQNLNIGGQLNTSGSINSLSSNLVFNAGAHGMEFNIDSDGSGGDNFVYKIHGIEVMNIKDGGVVIPDGGDITNIDWDNITVNKPNLQIDINSSCAEGSSIREIKDDGSVVCEVDDGAADTFNTCNYFDGKICPEDTLLRGYSATQVYCCGTDLTGCTFQDWTTISTTEYNCVHSGYECGNSYDNWYQDRQKKVHANCFTEYRYTEYESGANYSENCGSCPPGESCRWGSCSEGGSTPYLFTNIAKNNYIENDVMATFWDVDYYGAKGMYEDALENETEFSNKKYRQTDKYIMAKNPDVLAGSLALKIEEIEPEESYLDQIKLARVFYDENTELIVDNQTNKLRSIKKEQVKDALTECQFNGDKCLNKVKDNDNNSVYGNAGDSIEIKIDIKNLKSKDIYLTMNSWGSTPLPLSSDFKAKSEASLSVFFDINNNGEYTELNQIHPRELETTAHLDITDIIEKSESDIINLKIVWTQEHWIDQISVVTSEEKEYRLEELLLTKANHSRDGSILDSLSEKDQKYAHTIQGDSIDLEFKAGRYIQKDNEKEAYVFISSGFYTSLRESLYPDLKVDHDWQKRVDAYVEELNELK